MRDVRAILGGVPGFETASVRAVLSDGPTNASYRVERDGMDLVLRVDKPAAAELGLMAGADWETTGRIASLMGAIKISTHGTQNHELNPDSFRERFVENFGYEPGV